MPQFNHFLLTRFNVRTSYTKAPENTINNKNWLNNRFRLFEKFCYPSIMGQSNQNFKWLVFFDEKTPEKAKFQISCYTQYSNFIPIYIEKWEQKTASELLRPIIKQYFSDAKPVYLITSRSDNDDAIHKDYIQIIQNNFREQKFQLLNLDLGYSLDQDTGKVYIKKYPSNPFMSLIESTENFLTIFTVPHDNLHIKYANAQLYQSLRTKPAWIQVIHGGNVSNKIVGVRQSRKKLENNFIINLNDIPDKEKWLFLRLEQIKNQLTRFRNKIKYQTLGLIVKVFKTKKSGSDK